MPNPMDNCAFCGELFEKTRSTRRYCGDKCQRGGELARRKARGRPLTDAERAKKRDGDRARDRAKRMADPEGARAMDRARRAKRKAEGKGNIETDARRNSRLRRKYGITLEEKVAMAAAQGGRCALCKQIPSEAYGLVVDHCHNSSRIRALLCHRCNTALGLLQDDQQRLLDAVAYLQAHEVTDEAA